MILSGKEIYNQLGKNIFIDPFNCKQLSTNSYNLCLFNELKIYIDPLDMKYENRLESITIPEEGLIIKPNILYLARTVEYTKTYNLIPVIEGRSSIARLGISIHLASGLGDIGFEGYWTLELTCVQPVKIYPNVQICQVIYHKISGEYDNYSDKYQKNIGIQKSSLFQEFEN